MGKWDYGDQYDACYTDGLSREEFHKERERLKRIEEYEEEERRREQEEQDRKDEEERRYQEYIRQEEIDAGDW